MDIAILNYPTGEVDIIRDAQVYFNYQFTDSVEEFLEAQGYNINEIHYMCADELTINDPHEF